MVFMHSFVYFLAATLNRLSAIRFWQGLCIRIIAS